LVRMPRQHAASLRNAAQAEQAANRALAPDGRGELPR
jgi:hypothetical protein